MKKVRLIVAAIFAISSVLGAALPESEEADTWGGRREHPAVVNPVLGDDGERVISLRGDWEFTVMGVGSRNGYGKRIYDEGPWPWPCMIKVPGCWEAQGIGKPGMSECWDIKGDNNAKPIRHVHVGYACYRKTVPIPAEWKGRRVWLKIGGVKSTGWFWVNKRQVAMNENYCGTYKYEITDIVTPGSNATVVAHVTNARPSRKGQMSAMHKWGGIYRDIEIEATPETFIDDAWVRGDFDRREAEVHVELDGPRAKGMKLRVSIDKSVVEKALDASDDQVIRLPLADFRPWSPEAPNLYTARVDLVNSGNVVHTRRERFGVRKFEVRGKEFYLNDRPFYLRGFGDDNVYPITGITPADRNFHLAHLRKAREAGFNFVRLHTHCEVPEYFEAADEAGIMVQAELPYYGDNTAEAMSFDPKRDVTELWRNYRRHPSFAIYCNGNEGSFGPVLDRRLYDYVKSIDPDRLKIGQDNHEQWSNPPEAADFLQTHALPWARGRVNHDRPFVAHEYLNLSVKSDSRDEEKYTGVWLPPATRKNRAEWLARFGLGMRWGDRLQDAQHALQRHYQKQGIEWIRADPYCDGYWFWTIADVVVENRKADPGVYTAQGLFNPFWEQKRGGASAAEFAEFNSESCLLLDVPDTSRVFASGDILDADFLFANYGTAPLRDSVLEWWPGAGGEDGRRPVGDIPVGSARKIASARIAFPDVDKPVKACLSANVGCVSNSWDFWVFPRRAVRDGGSIAVADTFRDALGKRYRGLLPEGDAPKAKIVIAEYDSRLASESLARGQRVITIAGADSEPNVKLGWWWLGSQTGVALADHPALASLPHEGHMSPLLFRLVRHGGQALPCPGLREDDILMVGEGATNCVLHLAQANVGRGKAIMAFGLGLMGDSPEAAALLDGLIDYASSESFAPVSRLPVEGESVSFGVDSPYGACAHVTRNEPVAQTCAAMGEAGLRWVRSDFDWRAVEKSPGVWDFTEYDRILSDCEAAGMQLLPILYSPPKWAEPAWKHLDEWADFVRRVVARYGRRLPVVEIWNEQNASGFWGDRPNTTNYLAVLRRAYDTVKSVDPSIRVAFGGTAEVPLDFIEDIYRLGGADAFDIMNIHPYTQPYRPEGEMDVNLEKLRELMTRYGDGEKPIWITEVGWPTHSIVPTDADVLMAGLKVARPETKTWRALYVPAQADIDGVLDEAMRQTLEDILPDGSRVETCRAPDVASRLARGDVDAVIYPFSEDFAIDCADTVFDFVKTGGVLVDFGGMPMYSAYSMAPDGSTHRAEEPFPTRDRDRLRIGMAAWWMDGRYPKSIVVTPTAAAADAQPPSGGFKGERFFADSLLKTGDEFVPLLAAHTNGIDVVAAAVYKFGSDMKGAVVASGLLNVGCRGTSDEARQAKMCARALGIAFAEGVERLFWYEFRQFEKFPGSPESFYGLVRKDFSPKPALGAYRAFMDVRPAGSIQRPAKWRTADGKTFFPQWTRPDRRVAGMLWTVGVPRRREVEFSSLDMVFFDAAGAEVCLERKGCAYSLEITDSPLYFIGGELVNALMLE